MATISELETMIAEAKAHRHQIALGNAVIEVWRDGRRVRKHIANSAELENYIRSLERELENLTAANAGRPKRRPIALAWRN